MAKRTSRSKTQTWDIWAEPPIKHTLLLSCMDTRLVDDTTRFMNGLNLTNRYDQIMFAGAAMGVQQLDSDVGGVKLRWEHVFFDHLKAAIDNLKREIKDIIILEHHDCGAYKYLHPNGTIQQKYYAHVVKREMQKLNPFHANEAKSLKTAIETYCKQRQTDPNVPDQKAWKDIRVHALVMNLRGQVTAL